MRYEFARRASKVDPYVWKNWESVSVFEIWCRVLELPRTRWQRLRRYAEREPAEKDIDTARRHAAMSNVELEYELRESVQ